MNTRERIRYSLMLAVVLICASLIVTVLFYQRTEETAQVVQDIVMQADVTLHELNYTETEDGVEQWNLIADSAAHDVKQEVTALENIRMKFFNQGEVGDVELTAKSGTINMATSHVYASGDVVIKAQSGYTFSSDSVSFAGKSTQDGKITTDDAVKIANDNFVVTGIGFSGDLSRGKFKLKRNVTAIYYPTPLKGGQ